MKMIRPGIGNGEEHENAAMMLLPVAGALIGAVLFFGMRLLTNRPVNVSFKGMIALALILIITGGMHAAGFMSSVARTKGSDRGMYYGVSAFVAAALLAVSCLGIIIHLEISKEMPLFILACGIIVISRAVAVLITLFSRKSQDGGTLPAAVVMIELVAVLSLMAYINVVYAGVIAGAFVVYTVIHVLSAKKREDSERESSDRYVVVSEVFALFCFAASAVILTASV